MTLSAPLRLYTTTGAPNPRRLGLFLGAKGLVLPEVLEVSIMGGDSRRPEFLALTHGFSGLPILELEDGTMISESTSIARYLEALHPEPNLFGQEAQEAALIDMWMRRSELGLFQEIRAAFRHLHPRMKVIEEQMPAWGEANKPRAILSLRQFEARLSSSLWLAGARFTMADIELLTAVDFLKMARIELPPELAAVARWRAAALAACGQG